MTEAAPSMTRRGFFGHAAGAYALVTIAGAGGTADVLSMLIERHRSTAKAWGDACMACDEDPSQQNMQIEGSLAQADEDTMTALLEHRPADLGEAAQRFAYLYGDGGHWTFFQPRHDQIETLVKSMLPETV